MNRITTASLSLAAITAVFSMATACASGGDDPDDDGKAGNASNGGSSSGSGNNTSGNGTSGSGTSGNGTSGSGTSGNASGGSGGGSSDSGVCKGAATYLLPEEEGFIDNFEDMTRFPGWYAFSDTDPPNEPIPARVEEGALETGWSGHVTATGITSSKMMGYGAGFGFGLVDTAKGACVDLQNFDGISFWIKGSVGTDNALKFQIVSPATQPTNEKPPGDCVPDTACAFKHPAKTIMVTAEWAHVVIKWSELAPAAAFTGKVLGFNMINDGPAYDVNIDEVTLFKGTAPEGALEVTGAGGATQ